MSFKDYYHKKLNEEGYYDGRGLDDEAEYAPAQQNVQQKQTSSGNAASSLVNAYIAKGNGNLKVSLAGLGKDIGEAIFKYATEELVKAEDFDSEDVYTKFINSIRDKVAEGYNATLVEVLKNIGIYVDNQKNILTK